MCLHAAARKGHVGVVRALLSKGATVDTKTKVRPYCLFSVDEFLYSPHLLTGNCKNEFPLALPAAVQIYLNKRKRLHSFTFQLSQN